MTLSEVEARAVRHGLYSYAQWQEYMQRHYEVMPQWWWHDTNRENVYKNWVIRATVEDEQDESKGPTA